MLFLAHKVFWLQFCGRFQPFNTGHKKRYPFPLLGYRCWDSGKSETGQFSPAFNRPHYFCDKKEKVQFSFSKFIKSFPNSIKPGKVVLLLDKPHETHIVRKRNPRFTKSSNLVFIGRILNEIQRLRNSKIYFKKRVNARTLSHQNSN